MATEPVDGGRITLPETNDGYALAPDDGEALWFNTGLGLLKATAEQTDGRYAALELRLPKNFASPIHVHHNEDEFFLVLRSCDADRDHDASQPECSGTAAPAEGLIRDEYLSQDRRRRASDLAALNRVTSGGMLKRQDGVSPPVGLSIRPGRTLQLEPSGRDGVTVRYCVSEA